MLSNEVHFLKAPILMIFTNEGILISFKDEQQQNAFRPIFSAKFDSLTLINDVHPLKQSISICLTKFGMEM